MQPFFQRLYSRCTPFSDACLTLTAIHPNGNRPTPSRHVSWSDPNALERALSALFTANAQGWGAYFAVGLRRGGLTRWRRGGLSEVIALPALFVDVDDPSDATRSRLERLSPAPSCLVFSGGGYHAYWWLDEPLTDLEVARRWLQALAKRTDGDPLSPAQSLRLPTTMNNKLGRGGKRCEILSLSEVRYALTDFPALQPVHSKVRTRNANRSSNPKFSRTTYLTLMESVAQVLRARGYRRSGDWLNGRCPFPERHQHGDLHPSFGFNLCSGYGHCHVCGTLRLKDLCPALGIAEGR